ncbi:uncharacterized protein LOC143024656 [Oratosquilla oratoria]|uniref:uncharacterized protein LOC143024656 n=1 Tax=Oratosquilla oratoria TaxID=337810 RepID=UPI003F76EAF1
MVDLRCPVSSLSCRTWLWRWCLHKPFVIRGPCFQTPPEVCEARITTRKDGKRTMFWFELLNFGEGSVDRDLSCGRYIGHISVNMDVYIDKISLSYGGTIDIKRHGTTILTAHSEDGGYSFPRTEKLLANESYGIYLKSSETVPFLLTWPPQDQDAYEAHIVGESFLAEESIGFAMDD